ncbi:hypothetical protein DMH04_53405 [Kibdelosporangium aridum]|uniref:Uncharacterized protein n=1 Tax=Kibdelosporangium aridum TaxID=2030 RepID=A0A428Y319_KIBAR|nr:hypothetical protein [Kibdelosporangium aridum]RSM61956.1 hypothetical protein DMH04_53405 [Kibdelosporangium aridum]
MTMAACRCGEFLCFLDENHWQTESHEGVEPTVFAFLAHHVLGEPWRRPEHLADQPKHHEGRRAQHEAPLDLTKVTRRDILEHMFENFSSLSRSDRDMAQDLLAELIPRQRPPMDDQPRKFWGPGGGGGGYPGPADADLK